MISRAVLEPVMGIQLEAAGQVSGSWCFSRVVLEPIMGQWSCSSWWFKRDGDSQ